MSDTKSKILLAASELFLSGGVSALSVRAISKKAGLSTIGIYSHFQGKQGVLDTLYIEGFSMVAEAVSVVTDDCTGRDAVLKAIENYLEFCEQHEAHYRLIFGESDDEYQPSDEAREVGLHAFTQMARTCATLLPEDATREEKQDVAMQIWSTAHGYVSLNHHAVTQIVNMQNWKERVTEAVLMMVAAVERNVADKASSTSK